MTDPTVNDRPGTPGESPRPTPDTSASTPSTPAPAGVSHGEATAAGGEGSGDGSDGPPRPKRRRGSHGGRDRNRPAGAREGGDDRDGLLGLDPVDAHSGRTGSAGASRGS